MDINQNADDGLEYLPLSERFILSKKIKWGLLISGFLTIGIWGLLMPFTYSSNLAILLSILFAAFNFICASRCYKGYLLYVPIKKNKEYYAILNDVLTYPEGKDILISLGKTPDQLTLIEVLAVKNRLELAAFNSLSS